VTNIKFNLEHFAQDIAGLHSMMRKLAQSMLVSRYKITRLSH